MAVNSPPPLGPLSCGASDVGSEGSYGGPCWVGSRSEQFQQFPTAYPRTLSQSSQRMSGRRSSASSYSYADSERSACSKTEQRTDPGKEFVTGGLPVPPEVIPGIGEQRWV